MGGWRVTPDDIDRGIKLMGEYNAAMNGARIQQKLAAEHPKHDGYCFKCRDKKTVYTEKVRASAAPNVHNHRGKCGDCGTSVTSFKRKDA